MLNTIVRFNVTTFINTKFVILRVSFSRRFSGQFFDANYQANGAISISQEIPLAITSIDIIRPSHVIQKSSLSRILLFESDISVANDNTELATAIPSVP